MAKIGKEIIANKEMNQKIKIVHNPQKSEKGKPKNELYSDLLKKPQWQKRRLEIFQRDNWACKCCGDTESELHVHHKLYRDNLSPWQYNDNELITLCSVCHGILHQLERINKLKEGFDFSVFKAIDYIDPEIYFAVYGGSLYYISIGINPISGVRNVFKIELCLEMPSFGLFADFIKNNCTWR